MVEVTTLEELKGIANCCEHEPTRTRLNALVEQYPANHELVALPIYPDESSRTGPSKTMAEALTMLDFGLAFALCNREHGGTRRDVKKAQVELEVLKPMVERLQHNHDRMGLMLRDIVLASGVELPDDITDALPPGPDLIALSMDVVEKLKVERARGDAAVGDANDAERGVREMAGVIVNLKAIVDQELMPQIGKLFIQDFQRLNETLMRASKVLHDQGYP